jgi:hypothetical protein
VSPRRRLCSVVAAAALVASACAPDQPVATTGCVSLTNCPLYQVCDRSSGTCIHEPPNRLLGAFNCAIVSPDAPDLTTLHVSEVIANVDQDRYALSLLVRCELDAKNDRVQFMLGTADTTGNELTITLTASKAKAGRNTLGLALTDIARDGAILDNDTDYTRRATSTTGFLDLDTAPVIGATVSAYADITLFPAATPRTLFGEPCPHGIADCGELEGRAGGASGCDEFQDRPGHSICNRICQGDGDCAIGNGICIGGVCSKRCTSDADCTKPTTCFVESASRRGCF